MGVYLFLIVICSFCAVRYDIICQKKGSDVVFWGLGALLIIIAGVRYQIGADTASYMEEFQYAKELSELSAYDFEDTRYMPGWIIFASACKTLCNDFWGLQLIHAFILNVSVFLFINNFSQHRFTTVFVYVLLGYINLNTEILRESLAMSLFLLATAAFMKNKWGPYFLICCIVSTIHVSGFITFFFPLGKLFSISTRRGIILTSLFVIVLANTIWSLFQSHIVDFLSMNAIQAGVDAYLNDTYTFNINGIIVNLASKSLFPFIFIYLGLRNELKSSNMIQLGYIYSVLGLFVAFNSVLFLRFQTYVTIPFLIIVADVTVPLIKQRKGIVALFLLGTLILPQYYTYLNPETNIDNPNLKNYVYERYVPYRTWFEHSASMNY